MGTKLFGGAVVAKRQRGIKMANGKWEYKRAAIAHLAWCIVGLKLTSQSQDQNRRF